MKIYINPGHGGHDSGATGYGRTEKADNLRYASAVAEQLGKAGHVVELERNADYYISVTDIAENAYAWGADLFVSFHRNSGGGVGVECLIVSSASATSRRLAQEIQNRLVGVGFRDRGVKVQDKNTHVLKATNMPATTIEAGFIDSATDNALFDSKQSEIVHAVTNGILAIAGGSVPEPPPVQPEPNRELVEDFVRRQYMSGLGRQPDATGWNSWVSDLMVRRKSPAEVSYAILFSTEGYNKKPVNKDFVATCYLCLLGRMPDPIGEKTWLDGLYTNDSRTDVFNLIAGGGEFNNISKNMGF